jgi:hypothetical protein
MKVPLCCADTRAPANNRLSRLRNPLSDTTRKFANIVALDVAGDDARIELLR